MNEADSKRAEQDDAGGGDAVARPARNPDAVAPGSDGAAAETKAADDEIGGPKGPEPTRFGDWERKGRCIDF